MAVKVLSTTVTGANTSTALTATSTPCTMCIIQADKDNAAIVWVGDSTLLAASDNGIVISTTDGDAFPAQITIFDSSGANTINLKDVYICSPNASARVNVLYNQQ
jgi:hypothetical protein